MPVTTAQKGTSNGSLLALLGHVGILGSIAEMLDVQTLQTVISNIDDFCRSVPMTVVETVLKELFGQRWRLYYDAYVSFVHEHNLDTSQQNSRIRRLDVWPHITREHPWGLGYDLSIPPEVAMTNGYVVATAIKTLDSIAQNCKDYDYSFIPGEPSKCDIYRISFVENGRLIWIKYCPEMYDYDKDLDILNDKINLSSLKNSWKYSRLEGQVLLRNDEPARVMVALNGAQELRPKEVVGFQYELWDLGAEPHPRCLWSSLWNAVFRMQYLDVSQHIFPLTTFRLQQCDGFLIPSMKGFYNSFFVDLVDEQEEWSYFDHGEFQGPVRFVKCVSTVAVIDLLRLEHMDFHGIKKLTVPRLSNDSKYLAAVVSKSDGDSSPLYAVIWRVALPRPTLVWENGVEISCTDCYFFIDQKWLIIACMTHGVQAYPLTSPNPRAIELTQLLPSWEDDDIWLKMCGLDGNVLYCYVPSTKSYRFIKLSESKKREWTALPVYLSPDRPVSATLDATTALGFKAYSYVHEVGKRYCLSTTGDLFDLGSAQMDAGTITLRCMDMKSLKVLAIGESPINALTVAACYDSHEADPVLMLTLLGPLREEHRLTTWDTPILYKDVGLAIFSPDAMKIFVWSFIKDTGWILLIKRRPGSRPSRFYIRQLPRFNFSSSSDDAIDDWPVLRWPVFLAEDMIAIVSQNIDTDEYDPEDEVAFYKNAKSTVMMIRIDHDTYQLECSSIGPPGVENFNKDGKRVYFPRWIDVLQEKPRELDFCSSITYIGTRAALSPSHRFLLYPSDRDLETESVPLVELHDLVSPAQKPPADFRRSWISFAHSLRLRRDYRRVNIYRADP